MDDEPIAFFTRNFGSPWVYRQWGGNCCRSPYCLPTTIVYSAKNKFNYICRTQSINIYAHMLTNGYINTYISTQINAFRLRLPLVCLILSFPSVSLIIFRTINILRPSAILLSTAVTAVPSSCTLLTAGPHSRSSSRARSGGQPCRLLLEYHLFRHAPMVMALSYLRTWGAGVACCSRLEDAW